jgi:hypothetical protein
MVVFLSHCILDDEIVMMPFEIAVIQGVYSYNEHHNK